MKKYYKWAKEGSVPTRLIEEIELGRQMTISEWAKYFDTNYSHMMITLVNLRKHGYHYHPHAGKVQTSKGLKTGILVDIMTKQAYLQSGLNTYEDNLALPHLDGVLKKIESGLIKFPQLEDKIQMFADRLSEKLIESHKRVRAQKKEQNKEENN